MAEIFIYKNNINTKRKLKIVKACFSGNEGIEQWNVNIQDCDHVLKIKWPCILFEQLSKLLAINGIEIAELPG